MGNVLGGARDYSDSAHDHLMTDVQPDADIARIVVGRMMQYVRTHYTSWSEGLARVALGVILMSTANSIKTHDMIRPHTSRRVEIISVRTEGRRTCSRMARFACSTG